MKERGTKREARLARPNHIPFDAEQAKGFDLLVASVADLLTQLSAPVGRCGYHQVCSVALRLICSVEESKACGALLLMSNVCNQMECIITCTCAQARIETRLGFQSNASPFSHSLKIVSSCFSLLHLSLKGNGSPELHEFTFRSSNSPF